MPGAKSVGQALKYLHSKHGDDMAFVASESSDKFNLEYVPLASTSPSLNDILGIGGIPAGRMVQIAGSESSGKTLLTLDFIAKAQKQDPNAWAIFVDAEFTFDKAWAAKLGVDLDRLLVIQENDAAKIWTSLCGDIKLKDTVGLLQKAAEDESLAGLKIVALDSIASIIPPVEMARNFEDQDMAALARFLPKALRRLTPYLSRQGITFIGINQVRVSPGVMYGNPEGEPGGRALKHACSMMLHVAKINQSNTQLKDGDGNQIGHRIRVRIDKNKCASAYKVTEFDIKYLEGIVNTDKEIVDLSIKYGTIKQAGSIFEYNNEKFKGREKLFAYINSNPQLTAQLLKSIEEAKLSHKEKTLSDLTLDELVAKASELEIIIPQADLDSREAVLTHIQSLSGE